MRLKLFMSVVVVGCVAGLAGPSLLAQTAAQQKAFGGLKLVDPDNPRGLETDISLVVEADHLILIDPRLKKEVKSLPYTAIKGIEDSYSATPPLPAGKISGASTGAGSMPAYLGREPHHWWTITTDGAPVILRVSAKNYDQLKAKIAEHNVKIQESAAKKK